MRKVTTFVLLLSTMLVFAEEPTINIEGLSEDQDKNVRAYLSLLQENCQSPDWRIDKLYVKADKDISKALRALGYYQVTTSKQLKFTDSCWEVNFNISANEPVRVKSLIVKVVGEAEQDANFKLLLANLPIKQNDILNHGNYEKIKQDLRSLCLETGYLNYKLVKKSLFVNPEKKQADIEIALDSGDRLRFGAINIEQDVLDPDFIKRYVSINENDFYSSQQLAKTYNSLAGSIYFGSIEVQPQMDKIVDSKVPVEISLTARKPHDYSFGLGYDTDIGPLASFGYQNRRLNREGHYVSFDMDVSPILSSVESTYMIPFTYPQKDYLSIGLGYQYESPDSFESQEGKISFQYHHLYQNNWKQILFLDLSYEQSTIADDSQSTLLLVHGANWQYTIKNHPLRPTQGYHLNFSIAAAPESIVSDVMFAQARAEAKLIMPLPWEARFITRAKLGGTLVSDFDRLPASYRFFAGGIETVRGYEYKELGTVNDENEVIGGKYLSVVSAEYEHFINQSWGIAAFIDAGNAYNENDININLGVGLGVRWISPIGAVGLDFAVPLDESDSSFQIHFAIGGQL